MLSHVEQMLTALESTDKLEGALREGKWELGRSREAVERLLEELRGDITTAAESNVRALNNALQTRLMGIAQSADRASVDALATAAINDARSLFLSKFVATIRALFADKAAEWQRQQAGVAAANLDSEALNAMIALDNEYNLGLSDVGHSYDATAASVLGMAASVVLTKGLLGKGALGRAGAKLIGGKVAADTVKNTAAVAKAADTAKKTSDAARYTKLVAVKVKSWEKDGFLTQMIGKVTEAVAKPQRVRAVMDYLSAHVVPDYHTELQAAAERVKREAADMMLREAERLNADRTAALAALQKDIDERRASASEKRQELKECQKILLQA